MRMKSIAGLAAGILLGMVLSAVVQSTQSGAERGQLRAQAQTVEQQLTQEMTQDQGQEAVDGGGSDPATHSSNNPRSATDILGMDILSPDEEKIGEVEDIIIDMESGQILAVVVATGGFLDSDQGPRQISPKELRFDSDRKNLLADLSEEQIESAPRFSSGDVGSLEEVPLIGGNQSGSSNSGAEERTDNRDGSQETQTDRADGRLPAATESGEPQPEEGEDNSDEQESNESRADRTEGRSASSGKGLAVSGLLDMNIENPQGESIGAVEKVYLDLEKGEAIGVVVSTGGFLGMGDRKTLLGVNELEYNSEKKILIVDFNKEQLGGFPQYKENERAAFDALRKRLEQSDESSPER